MPSTTRYRRRDIVLVSFPFTDLSSSKRRPALVISPDSFNEQGQDVVLYRHHLRKLARRTTRSPSRSSDCVDGALPKTSVVKLAKAVHGSLHPRAQDNLCAPARKAGGGSWRTAPVLLIDVRPGFARWSDEVDGDSHTVLSCFHLVGVFRTPLRFATIACGARIRSNPIGLDRGALESRSLDRRCMSARISDVGLPNSIPWLSATLVLRTSVGRWRRLTAPTLGSMVVNTLVGGTTTIAEIVPHTAQTHRLRDSMLAPCQHPRP